MYHKEKVLACEDADIVGIDSVLPVQLETSQLGETTTGLLDAGTVEDILETDHVLNEIGDSEQLIEVGQTFERLENNLAQRTSANPLSRQAAEALDIAIGGMIERKVFALEHFEGRPSRVIGTKMALEDLGENIRLVVQRIIRWIKRASEIVFDLIEGMIRGANATSRQAEELQDLAERTRAQYGDDAKDDRHISSRKLRTLFSENAGEPYGAVDIKKHYEQLTKDFNDTLAGKTVIAGSQYLASQIHAILNKNKTGKFSEFVAEGFAHDTILKMLGDNFPQFEQKDKDGTSMIYRPPFGGTEFVLSVTEKDDKLVAISLIRKSVEVNKQSSLPVLKPSEVAMLAKTVEASMHRGLYREYKRIKSTLYSLKTAISDMCDEISRQQRTTYDGTIPSLHFLKTSSETLLRMVNYGYSFNGLIARSILEYGRMSLKQYGKVE